MNIKRKNVLGRTRKRWSYNDGSAFVGGNNYRSNYWSEAIMKWTMELCWSEWHSTTCSGPSCSLGSLLQESYSNWRYYSTVLLITVLLNTITILILLYSSSYSTYILFVLTMVEWNVCDCIKSVWIGVAIRKGVSRTHRGKTTSELWTIPTTMEESMKRKKTAFHRRPV